MSKIVIIGGGASGLATAITAARSGCEVIILERNKVCGKKLLMTGNGKCNYWNSDQELIHYHSSMPERLSRIITNENKKSVLEFFDTIGIIPKIKSGYYYPYSNTATSIQYALLKECEVNGVTLIYDFLVTKIIRKEDRFLINDSIFCDKVVLASGSKACPKTGSDGTGYELAKSFGHTIVNVTPALVQLRGDASYFKLWNGIRTQARVTLYIDNVLVKEEEGELQLTDYGVSGICVFNISRYVAHALKKQKRVSLEINFIPWFGDTSFIKWMDDRNHQVRNRAVYELMEGFLHYKLVDILLRKSHIDKEKRWEELIEEERNILEQNIMHFIVNIQDTNSFQQAQVCTGGVSLSEIYPETMESKIIKNLYIVGELLDVDGDCGGYNLGFAWMSGILAGKGVDHD